MLCIRWPRGKWAASLWRAFAGGPLPPVVQQERFSSRCRSPFLRGSAAASSRLNAVTTAPRSSSFGSARSTDACGFSPGCQPSSSSPQEE